MYGPPQFSKTNGYCDCSFCEVLLNKSSFARDSLDKKLNYTYKQNQKAKVFKQLISHRELYYPGLIELTYGLLQIGIMIVAKTRSITKRPRLQKSQWQFKL